MIRSENINRERKERLRRCVPEFACVNVFVGDMCMVCVCVCVVRTVFEKIVSLSLAERNCE